MRGVAEMRLWLAAGIVMLAAVACPALEVTDQLGPLPEKGILVADVAEMTFRLEGAKGLIGNVGGRKTQFLQYLNMSEGFERGPVQEGGQAELGSRIYQSTIERYQDIEPWVTEVTGIEPGRAASFRATGRLHSQFTETGEAQVVDEGHSQMTVTWEREPAENARMSLMVYLFKWLQDQPLFIMRPDGTVVDEVEGEPLRTWATGVHGVFPAGTRLIFPIGVGETAAFTTHEEATLASFSMGVFFGGFSLTPTDATAKTCQVSIERVTTAQEVACTDVRAVVDTATGISAVYRGPYKVIEELSLTEGAEAQRPLLTGTDGAWQGRQDEYGGLALTGTLESSWEQVVRKAASGLGGGAVWLQYSREDVGAGVELRLVLPPVHVGQPLALSQSGPVTVGGAQVRTGCEAEFALPADESLLMPLARGQALALDPDSDCTVSLQRVRGDRAAIVLRFAPTQKRIQMTIDCGPPPADLPVASYTERDYAALREVQRPDLGDKLGLVTSAPGPGDLQVVSQYWTVTHSARAGGSVSQIEFNSGRPGGVLTGPMATRIGDLSDIYDPAATLEVTERSADRIVARARGHLCDEAGRPSPVAFETTYEYHPCYMIRTVRLTPAEPLQDIARLTVTEAACAPSLNEFAGGTSFPIWGRAIFPGPPVYERRGLPDYMTLFERDVQCLEMFPREDLTQWTDQLGGERDNCRWAIEGAPDGGGVMRLNAWDNADAPCTLNGPVEFSHFIGLPKIRLANREKHAWHMLSPDVSEDEVRRLAWLGCDSVHGLVGDPLITNAEGDWQRVAQRGRDLVAKCHKYGLEVIPYLFFLPMRQSNPVYAEHWDEWGVQPGKKDQACCTVQGWRDYYQAGLRRMLELAPYDGVYYDFVSVYECENPAHSDGPHSTVEGLMQTLAFTRLAVGEAGIIIGHRGHQANTVIDSYLDGVVVFEHYSHPQWLPLDELEPLNTFVGASRRDTCVKSLVCALGGLNPGARRAEGPRMEDMREIMCKLALQGLFPYAFSMWPKPQVEEFNRLYERFRSVDFDRLTFADHLHQSAVRCVDPYSRAAVFFNEDEAYVVIANPESEEPRNVNFVVDEEALGWPKGTAYALSEQPNPTSVTRAPAGRELDIALRFEGYEYRVWFLRRLTDERPQVVSSTHKWWESEEDGAPAV
ncbi:MAG TPA: hypothetical protein VM283_01775, partial [Armatimonadota bacterium]|nr:hypothetical protein [Armatimonadota bacterium]